VRRDAWSFACARALVRGAHIIVGIGMDQLRGPQPAGVVPSVHEQ
jgi:hypothetical protein